MGDEAVYDITQHFRQPLKIVIRQNLGMGKYRDIAGTAEQHQVIRVKIPSKYPEIQYEDATLIRHDATAALSEEPTFDQKFRPQKMDRLWNADVADIFRNDYRSPRPPYTTLQIPLHGVGEWCHPTYMPEINDYTFRSMIVNDEFVAAGVPFRTPAEGHNIAYTSLWDNYPDSISVPVSGSASTAWLLMAGSTNHMQSRIANGIVVAQYKDGTADTLQLVNPDNWCPIEQDYYIDGKAFQTAQPRPYRISFETGKVSRDLGRLLNIQGVYGREIPGGAATMLRMPLNQRKKLRAIVVRTLSNDVVIGLMAITLQ